LEGGELQVGYGMETELPGGLTRLRKIPYPKSVRRVWSGYRQVTTRESRVKAFSLSGSCRVSRVKCDTPSVTVAATVFYNA
jgi:hypothetical protein